jgi:hypothetical protein
MQQQPILTADEVIELIERQVIETEDERVAFQQLLDDSKLTNAVITDPDTQIPLLEKCRKFLQGMGFSVFLGYEDLYPYGNLYCRLIVGECARLYHKLEKQTCFLTDLRDFICKNEDKLPPHLRSKKILLTHYSLETEHFPISPNSLLEAYIRSDKRKLEKACKEGWELANKVDAFLESIKDLQRLYVIETLL